MMTKTTYPTIRNCNFAARHDDRGRHVREALLAADRGCEDCDLIGALDDLEATLADHAEDDSEGSMRLCSEAEEAVEAALLAINAAFDEAQIDALEAEAAQHGDLLMAAVCRVAAGRDPAAIPLDDGERRRVEAMTADAALAEVARCLREAAAQRDD